ncbi:MAG: hypothetical protein ACLP8S_00880 [Solirubrobacteraceae bacterium]
MREEKRVTGTNWMTKGMSVINRPSASHAGLSKMNLSGMGPLMMRKLAAISLFI